MKKIFIFFAVFFTAQNLLFAHSLVLNTIDNEDGTMEVIGEFSTGVTAQGAMLKVQTLSNLKIVFEKRIPSSGSLIVNIPKEPYKIILDAGEGHIIQKDGIVTPLEGFIKTNNTSSNINFALYTTLAISSLFLILAFILSFARYKEFKTAKAV